MTMHSRAWINLLRRIPPEKQDILSLVTSAGTEISIQNIFRTEDDYLVLRGRLAGTTDAGRVFFIPYDQINYLGFQQEVREVEVHALYGDPSTAPTVQAEPAPPVTQEPASDSATGTASQSAAATVPGSRSGAGKTPLRLSLPGKEALLERLRARSQVGTTRLPPNP
jgi:hypothetical protein